MKAVLNTVNLSNKDARAFHSCCSYNPIGSMGKISCSRPKLYRISNYLEWYTEDYTKIALKLGLSIENERKRFSDKIQKLSDFGVTTEFIENELANRKINDDWVIDDVYCEKRKNVAGYIGEEIACIRFAFKSIASNGVRNPFLYSNGLTNFMSMKLGDRDFPMTRVEAGYDKRWMDDRYCEVYKVPLEIWDMIKKISMIRKRNTVTFVFSDDLLL